MYIPLPSACRFITRLDGHAIAAPVAQGGPCPIAPPVSVRCENMGACSDASQYVVPDVSDSSTMIAFTGCNRATMLHIFAEVKMPEGVDVNDGARSILLAKQQICFVCIYACIVSMQGEPIR